MYLSPFCLPCHHFSGSSLIKIWHFFLLLSFKLFVNPVLTTLTVLCMCYKGSVHHMPVCLSLLVLKFFWNTSYLDTCNLCSCLSDWNHILKACLEWEKLLLYVTWSVGLILLAGLNINKHFLILFCLYFIHHGLCVYISFFHTNFEVLKNVWITFLHVSYDLQQTNGLLMLSSA